MSPFKTWHFNISNCDKYYSSLIWIIWWLIPSILGHSPICPAVSPCPLGPLGLLCPLHVHFPLPESVLASRPLGLLYASFRFQSLPGTTSSPTRFFYLSSFGLYCYFMAFTWVLKLFIYLHNYLNNVLSFWIGCKPHDCRNQLAWCVIAE